MLNDLKILELASVLAGPSVGQFLAELGADVIKVENARTGGDVTRTWKTRNERTDDRSAYFCAVNWGKRSVALDLASPEGRDIVHRIAGKSDIVIASYKPGDAEKLGVDYATLSKLRKGLIYGQITGYGSGTARTGYDAVIQAEAGFMFMNGEPGGRSLKMPVALVDVLAGHHLKEALLVALIQRMKTGEGSFVEVSLLQAAVSSLVNQATNWLMAGHLPRKEGSAHPNIAPYGDSFSDADGQEFILAVGSDKQFSDLCRILSIPDVAMSPAFRTNPERVKNRSDLTSMLRERIRHFRIQTLMRDFYAAGIPAGIVRNLEQVFDEPHARELMLRAGDVCGLRTYLGSPALSNPLLLPPPHFGEHTQSVMAEL